MTDSRDDQGRPNCDECRFANTAMRFPNEFPCKMGHSVFFTCCVTECGDFRPKDVCVKEDKDDR